MKVIPKILRQTFWQILGKIITSLSTFIILGLVARNYGEAGTGIFTLILTYLGIFYLLSDFGFNAHELKRVTSNKVQVTSEWQKLLGTRIVWALLLVGVAVGLLPLWPFGNPLFNQGVLIGSLAILGSGIFVTSNLIFQSKLRYDLSVLASGIGTLLSLGIFVYLSFGKSPIPVLMLAHLTGWIVIALTSLLLAGRFLNRLFPIFDFQYIISLFKGSWPIAATLVVNVVYFRADAFMIAHFKGLSDVGVYNTAYILFQSALVLPAFIMNAYYPLMLKSLTALKFVGAGLLALASAGTLLAFLLAPLLIQLLTGGGFAGSTQSLYILSLGFPAYFLSSLLMWLLVTKGRYKLMLLIYAAGLLVNLTLNFIFIPQYSYIAASWITVGSEYGILLLQAIALYWLKER